MGGMVDRVLRARKLRTDAIPRLSICSLYRMLEVRIEI